jgi:hypothetical protein
MKTINILNTITYVLILIGIIFKNAHYPGANIILLIGISGMLSSVVIYGMNEANETGMSKSLNYTLIIGLIIYIVALTFKLFHWPGGNMMMLLGYFIAIIIPVLMITQKSSFAVSRQYFTSFLLYFLLLIGTLPHNPIKYLFGHGDDQGYSQKMLEHLDSKTHQTDDSSGQE